jgi:hypothetical protein
MNIIQAGVIGLIWGIVVSFGGIIPICGDNKYRYWIAFVAITVLILISMTVTDYLIRGGI